jgi:hypothetical protein
MVRNRIAYDIKVWFSKYHIKINTSKCEAVNSLTTNYVTLRQLRQYSPTVDIKI